MLQEIHSNPLFLNYYLIKGEPENYNFEVIKKISISSFAGNIEAAIIGSSHYLRLENIFFEVLSCTAGKYKTENILFVAQKLSGISFERNFENFEYIFMSEVQQYETENSFYEFEQKLLETGKLVHSFKTNSAVTRLDFENNENSFVFKTWHTYPEYLQVIFSQTVLRKKEK